MGPLSAVYSALLLYYGDFKWLSGWIVLRKNIKNTEQYDKQAHF